ncbi:hypothetical protein VCHC47A1_3819, partial [Vibrio cholerae HC-47A1]
MARRYKPAHY